MFEETRDCRFVARHGADVRAAIRDKRVLVMTLLKEMRLTLRTVS